jgi:mannose-6-phosphate isomerase-like protein (cupin superfamily)
MPPITINKMKKEIFIQKTFRSLKWTILTMLLSFPTNASSQFLKRTLSDLPVVNIDISSPSASYKPIFGIGDNDSQIAKGLSRFGNLIIDSDGESKIVRYADEELVLYVLDGTGIIHYDDEEVPVAKNDFMYIPVGKEFGFANPREKSLSVLVMGFKIFQGTKVTPTNKLMIANADEVPFQVLPSHGPTTQFQLLMGTTESVRDRLASAYQVNSLFVMDFSVSGTNIPHRHNREEEIYLIIRGHGDIVAGETTDGKESRYPSKEGDVYFFPPKTLIGFYSGTKEGEENARILAIRYKYPASDSESSKK